MDVANLNFKDRRTIVEFLDMQLEKTINSILLCEKAAKFMNAEEKKNHKKILKNLMKKLEKITGEVN